MLTREQHLAENHPFIGDYKSSYDIKIFPKGFKARRAWCAELDSLSEIFDRLSLEHCFYATVDEILGRCSDMESPQDGRLLLCDDCIDECYGFIKDGYCYLSKNEVIHQFVERLFREGIEMNWPEEYLCEVFVRKGLIVPPPEYYSPDFSDEGRLMCYTSEIDGQTYELLLMKEKPVPRMPVEAAIRNN